MLSGSRTPPARVCAHTAEERLAGPDASACCLTDHHRSRLLRDVHAADRFKVPAVYLAQRLDHGSMFENILCSDTRCPRYRLGSQGDLRFSSWACRCSTEHAGREARKGRAIVPTEMAVEIIRAADGEVHEVLLESSCNLVDREAMVKTRRSRPTCQAPATISVVLRYTWCKVERLTFMEQEMEVINAQTDPETFGRLYDTYYQPVFGFLYSRTGRSEVAKDLTSETFFQALKNLHRYKSRPGASFKSWLFAIAVAQIGNYYRSRSRFLEVTTDEAPEIIAHDDFRPDAYRMGEMRLSFRTNRVAAAHDEQTQSTTSGYFDLALFSHMSVPEIAATLHMKEGTIKSHIHRALKKLQVLMLVEMDRTVVNMPVQSSKKYEPRTAQN